MKLRTLEVDFDDKNSLRKAFNLIKPRMVELEKRERTSNKEYNKIVFQACNEIFEYDISHIYKNKYESNEEYYVYAHCDPSLPINLNKKNPHGKLTFASLLGLKHIPFYIGKGVGNRAYDLNRNETHRKTRYFMKERGRDIEVYIIRENLTEAKALEIESKLIDIFGLKLLGGYLVNLDEGVSSKERQFLYSKFLRVIYPHDIRFKSVDEIGSTDIK